MNDSTSDVITAEVLSYVFLTSGWVLPSQYFLTVCLDIQGSVKLTGLIRLLYIEDVFRINVHFYDHTFHPPSNVYLHFKGFYMFGVTFHCHSVSKWYTFRVSFTVSLKYNNFMSNLH